MVSTISISSTIDKGSERVTVMVQISVPIALMSTGSTLRILMSEYDASVDIVNVDAS